MQILGKTRNRFWLDSQHIKHFEIIMLIMLGINTNTR